MIVVEQLRFDWQGQPVLDIPHFSLAAGQTLFLSGASGSGKSTLLALLAGLMVPQSGRLNVAGADLTQMRSVARDRWRAHKLGIIFQQFNLLPYLSGLDNVLLGAAFAGLHGAEARQRSLDMARQLDLDEPLLAKPARQLSVGQQQRVAALRALVPAPPLLIADEPTSALDDRHRDEFVRLLLSQSQAQGTTVLFVSHDLRLAGHFHGHQSLEQLNRVTTCSGA